MRISYMHVKRNSSSISISVFRRNIFLYSDRRSFPNSNKKGTHETCAMVYEKKYITSSYVMPWQVSPNLYSVISQDLHASNKISGNTQSHEAESCRNGYQYAHNTTSQTGEITLNNREGSLNKIKRKSLDFLGEGKEKKKLRMEGGIGILDNESDRMEEGLQYLFEEKPEVMDSSSIKSIDEEMDNTVVYESNIKTVDISKTLSNSDRKRRKKRSKYIFKDDSNSSEGDNDFKSINYKPRKARPTHFLAFRLYNRIIHDRAIELQDHVASINEDFKPSFINVPTLHMTLAVLTLSNPEEIQLAIEALDLSLKQVNEVYYKASCKFIEFDSLGAFRDEVIFINVKDTEGLKLLKEIVPILRDSMLQHNVACKKDLFTPHVTVMKLSKKFSKLKKNGIRKIPVYLYEAHKDKYFGKEELTEILLCSMADKKEDDGFYKILKAIDMNIDKISQLGDSTFSDEESLLDNGNSIKPCRDKEELKEQITSNKSKSFVDSWEIIEVEENRKHEQSWDIVSEDVGKVPVGRRTLNSRSHTKKSSCVIL